MQMQVDCLPVPKISVHTGFFISAKGSHYSARAQEIWLTVKHDCKLQEQHD
jgi:hypothetical protein